MAPQVKQLLTYLQEEFSPLAADKPEAALEVLQSVGNNYILVPNFEQQLFAGLSDVFKDMLTQRNLQSSPGDDFFDRNWDIDFVADLSYDDFSDLSCSTFDSGGDGCSGCSGCGGCGGCGD